MDNKSNNFVFIIRGVSLDNGTNDPEALLSLIQELANFQKMPNGPKLNIDHLRCFLKDGAANALIASATKGCETVVAGYAIYFVAPSTHFGKVFFLEDLYIRPIFRRQKLGSLFMSELGKIVKGLTCDVMQWNVLVDNTNAIRFYKSLGAIDLMNREGEGEMSCWRIESSEYEAIIRSSKECLPDIKFLVLSLDTVNEESASDLMECWHFLDSSSSSTVAEMNFMKMHRFSGLRVVQAQSVRDGTILGMALFHHCGFSSWTGPYITIDNMRVHGDQRRRGIGKKLVAELAQIATDLNCSRIGWAVRTNSEMKAFFKAVGAVNLTEKEGWLLYQLNV